MLLLLPSLPFGGDRCSFSLRFSLDLVGHVLLSWKLSPVVSGCCPFPSFLGEVLSVFFGFSGGLRVLCIVLVIGGLLPFLEINSYLSKKKNWLYFFWDLLLTFGFFNSNQGHHI